MKFLLHTFQKLTHRTRKISNSSFFLAISRKNIKYPAVVLKMRPTNVNYAPYYYSPTLVQKSMSRNINNTRKHSLLTGVQRN